MITPSIVNNSEEEKINCSTETTASKLCAETKILKSKEVSMTFAATTNIPFSNFRTSTDSLIKLPQESNKNANENGSNSSTARTSQHNNTSNSHIIIFLGLSALLGISIIFGYRIYSKSENSKALEKRYVIKLSNARR